MNDKTNVSTNSANQTKEQVQAVRDSIEVTHNKKDEEGNPIIKEPEDNDEVSNEEVKEETITEEVVETATTEEENKEENEAKDIKKLERTIEKLQKKVGKTTAERKELEAKINALEAKLQGTENILTEEDVNTRAEQLAEQKRIQKEFFANVNRLAAEATKLDKDFKKKIDEVVESVGIDCEFQDGKVRKVIPSVLIDVLSDIDNGSAILNYLANDEEEAERIFELHNKPLKMANAVNKLSAKIKPKTKEVSKAPDPPEKKLGGNGNKDSGFNPRDTKNTSDWIEKRNRDIAEKRASGRVNLR